MKNTKKYCLILFVLLFAANFSFSQEKRILTLSDSLNIALQQNPYHLASQKKVDAAKSGVREAVSGFLPSLNAQGLYTLDEKAMELEFPSMIPGQPPQRVEIDFTRDYQFTMSLSVPLFTGGRLISGFKQANYNLDAAKEAVRQSRHTTVFNTKRVFYGILLAEEFVKVSEEAVALAEKLHNNIKIQYEVGMASQFDLLRSEVQLANLKPQLIKARNNLNIMKLNLKTILGMDQNKEIEIQGKLTYEAVEPELDACLVKAMQNRPELKQLGFHKRIAGEGLKIARAAGLPSVAISGQYNYWADKLNFNKNNWSNFYQMNLTMSIPIFNGFATGARVGQAKAAIKELEFNRKGLVDMLKFEVRQAILKINEAKESLLSQEKNVEQAEESLRIADLNFKEGLITMLDYNQAQSALTQAKTNYSQALYDYEVALAELDKAMGVG